MKSYDEATLERGGIVMMDEPLAKRDSSIHHFHHHEPSPATVNVSAERNSRGVNWSVTVIGAENVAQAMELMDKARSELEHRFGTVAEVK